MPPKLKWPSGFIGESNLAHEFNDCILRWGASKHTLTALFVVFRWVETIVTSLSPTLKLLDAFKRFGNEAVMLSQKIHTHIYLHRRCCTCHNFWRGNKLETSFCFFGCLPLAFSAPHLHQTSTTQNRLGLPTTMPCWNVCFSRPL